MKADSTQATKEADKVCDKEPMNEGNLSSAESSLTLAL